MVTDEMVEIAARSDAKFDRRPFDGLGRADKQRYLDRSRAALEAALAVAPNDDGARRGELIHLANRLHSRAAVHTAQGHHDEWGKLLLEAEQIIRQFAGDAPAPVKE